jgi:hypothetical protein
LPCAAGPQRYASGEVSEWAAKEQQDGTAMSIARALFGLCIMLLVFLHESRPVKAITHDAEEAFSAFDGMVEDWATSVADGYGIADASASVEAAEQLLDKVEAATRKGLTRLETNWDEQLRMCTQSADI